MANKKNRLFLRIAIVAVVLVVVVLVVRIQLDAYAAEPASGDKTKPAATTLATATFNSTAQFIATKAGTTQGLVNAMLAIPIDPKIKDETRALSTGATIDDVGVGLEILPIPREYKIANVQNHLAELGIQNQVVAGVNLATQTAWVYKDGQIIWETPVVTAYSELGFATPTGVYEIYNKIEKHSLFNNYKCDYWLGFNLDWQEGFHDAQWRSDWSRDAYKYDGSGGCVNVPLDKMQELFGILDIGAIVWIHEYRDLL